MKPLRHGSLFSGIGAAEIAAEMLGWDNIFHCEINPFGRQVLEYWFPNSDSYEDITKTDFSQYKGQIDVLTGGFPCQPFSYAGKRGGRQMTAISGMKCSELLTKSDRCGLLAKMLMESPLWWSPLRLLKWEASPLYSTRETEFTDTDQSRPLPLNESAEILSQRDIQSNRCLFRLLLSAHHTEGTESSSLPIMLQTPTAVMTCESPENMRARAERKGYQNGTKFGSLASQVMFDQRVKSLLKTPCAMDATAEKRQSKGVSGTSGTLAQEIASGYVEKRGWNLPTPTARDYKPPYNEEAMIRKDGKCRNDMLSSLPTMMGLKQRGGADFLLSPLFTEEMMGFPLMWTTLPFLSQSGGQNP